MLDRENPAENSAEDTAENTATPGTAPSDAQTDPPADRDTAGTGAGGPADSPSQSDPTLPVEAEPPAVKKTAKKAAAKKTTAKKAATKKAATKKSAGKKTAEPALDGVEAPAGDAAESAPAEEVLAAEVAATEAPATDSATDSATDALGDAPAEGAVAKKATKRAAKKSTKKTTKKAVAKQDEPAAADTAADTAADSGDQGAQAATTGTALLFQAPDPAKAPARKRKSAKEAEPAPDEETRAPDTRADDKAGQKSRDDQGDGESGADESDTGDGDHEQGGSGRRRRRRGGRRRRKAGGEDGDGTESSADEAKGDQDKAGGDAHGGDNGDGSGDGSSSRRRRRRRRAGEEGDGASDDPQNTVTRVRKARSAEDEITSLSGSTRLEAKKQRRREGREAGRRRAPIVSEAEFLARRESVDRVMVIRQREDLTQIAVLEDKVLVEHYVARESQTSLIGNVYLGRVQNVLPSMEAAFIDIGKGRNAVLYAGEVNWDALGAKDGGQRKIEQVLKSGQTVLVQVTKDPVGHKGARLTSQISLPGRFLVYVPDGTTSGISRKLPDTERNRLKTLLKEIVPDTAGVIVRTAAEGASEDELTRDVERLTARWDDISGKAKGGNAPQLLYGEPDLTLKVVRDLFTEDFAKLVVSGADAWDMVDGYVEHVAPDLADRLEKYDGGEKGTDVFAAYRIDEQIAKGLDRKVWLPSGGSLIIDRTEAMTVVDVNTGKFTGSGGNLEETVTKNNLEAAEEIVRQLRLRDIGGIIVVDFIDMVLESNRDLVLRRLVECLGRDRTRHQVAEVTSLGLVQMTRKRIGTGLLEAFSETCEHCQGRGLLVHHEPIEPKKKQQEEEPRRGRRGRGRKADSDDSNGNGHSPSGPPSPKDVAAMAKPDAKRSDEATPEAAPEAAPEGTGVPAHEPGSGAAVKSGKTSKADETPAASEVPGDAPAEVPEPSADSPADAPVEAEPAEPVQPAEPAAPKIVTSVRRRSVRRPAGPPAGTAGSDGFGADDVSSANGSKSDTAQSTPAGADSADPADSVDGVEEPLEHVGEHVGAAHVPIKKKGSRKH
jgi:ribonuclease E